MGTNGYQLVPLGTGGYQWVPVFTSGYQWIPVGTIGYQWVPVGTSGYPLVPKGASGHQEYKEDQDQISVATCISDVVFVSVTQNISTKCAMIFLGCHVFDATAR